MNNILGLTNLEVRDFFLNKKSYCNIALPAYFNFQPLLNNLAKCKSINPSSFSVEKAKKNENVNYRFYNNKDGLFSWRQLQLINPVIYVYLVNIITEENNWKIIVDRFRQFQNNEKINCCSVPIEHKKRNSKKRTILNWWNEIEQKSIELALEYNCFLNTDITDCYGSIYTHSISWALHGKKESKANRLREKNERKRLLGDEIDGIVQSMSYGQTNGIPQGSILMDFIAEMVLGYADLKLTKKIKEYNKNAPTQNIDRYYILRYRDDYRIFGDTQEVIIKIAKMLTEVLQELNLKLNTQKTFVSDNIIKDSIKPDKYYWNGEKQIEKNIQKQLLLIHSLSQKHPNSGSLSKALDDFYRNIYPLKIYKNGNIKVLISILVDMAYKNPRTYPTICATIGKLLILETDNNIKKEIYASIKKKFAELPNTGYMQIWLQRLTIKINENEKYDDPLCKKVLDNSIDLWDISWVKEMDISKIFKDYPIVDELKIEKMDEIIKPIEVESIKSY